MEALLKSLEVLKKVNEHRNSKIYTEAEIKEKAENIAEMKELHIRLPQVLESLNEAAEKGDEEKQMRQLVDFYLVYSDFVWQYDQMHEMVKKGIKGGR